jgi:hypothetical protein
MRAFDSETVVSCGCRFELRMEFGDRKSVLILGFYATRQIMLVFQWKEAYVPREIDTKKSICHGLITCSAQFCQEDVDVSDKCGASEDIWRLLWQGRFPQDGLHRVHL